MVRGVGLLRSVNHCKSVRGTAEEGVVAVLRGLLATSVKRVIMSK